MLLALYHNLAASYLRLNNLKNAFQSCEEALKIDPKSNLIIFIILLGIKALFRKAKALSINDKATEKDIQEAIEILKLAQSIEPND